MNITECLKSNCTPYRSEDPARGLLVDHLDDADDGAADADGHAEERARGVARLLVNRGVEPLVLV